MSLDEELAIHDRRRRVEGCARDGRVDIVLSGDGVRNQEPDDLELIEVASVGEAGQNLIGGVYDTGRVRLTSSQSEMVQLTEGLGYQAIGSGLGSWWMSRCQEGSRTISSQHYHQRDLNDERGEQRGSCRAMTAYQ